MWQEAQIKEEHEGNGFIYLETTSIKLKTKINQSVIHLFPYLVFLIKRLLKEMVISVFCES